MCRCERDAMIIVSTALLTTLPAPPAEAKLPKFPSAIHQKVSETECARRDNTRYRLPVGDFRIKYRLRTKP